MRLESSQTNQRASLLKILIVDRASAFSIWTQLNAVALEAMAAGHEVVYCMLDTGADSAPPPPEGVRVHRIQAPGRKTIVNRVGQWLIFSRAFVSIVRRERPEIVHTNFCVPGIAARLIARLMGVPTIISTYHETRPSINRLYRTGLRLTDWTATHRAFVSTSNAASFDVSAPQVLTNPDDHPTSRDVVVRNGIARGAPFPSAPAPDRAAPTLTCAGRLMPIKGFATLIEALGKLRENGIAATLDILGDGTAKGALQAHAHALGVSDAVKFQGWSQHEETLEKLATSDCVVIPSEGAGEGFGLVLAEALAVAQRIVASDLPVFREVAEGLEEGVAFFPPGDAALLAEAIERSISEPVPDQLTNRRRRAAARYDIERMAKIYVALYGSTQQARRSGDDAPS